MWDISTIYFADTTEMFSWWNELVYFVDDTRLYDGERQGWPHKVAAFFRGPEHKTLLSAHYPLPCICQIRRSRLTSLLSLIVDTQLWSWGTSPLEAAHQIACPCGPSHIPHILWLLSHLSGLLLNLVMAKCPQPFKRPQRLNLPFFTSLFSSTVYWTHGFGYPTGTAYLVYLKLELIFPPPT